MKNLIRFLAVLAALSFGGFAFAGEKKAEDCKGCKDAAACCKAEKKEGCCKAEKKDCEKTPEKK
ncbi:MAG: hypothetical protein Q8J74_10810 [Candidatus Didemnitutus sp.]|nr:hypothetical protein [Candidatus Didemnitutus sp.]